MVEADSPEFELFYKFEVFNKRMLYHRQFNPELDADQIYKFFPVDEEERYPE